MQTQTAPNRNLAVLCGLGGLMAASILLMPELEAAKIEAITARLGPAAIVLLVALGIVVSPIPSGAVALVAGALYGTYQGGMLTIAGAVLGSGCAFTLSRYFGRGHVMSLKGAMAKALTRDRSQTALMGTIFVTRLIPFISFDAVSYLAGLTSIRFWRFLIATAAGTAPVCFAFAAAGDTASDGTLSPALLVAACGITVLLPAGVMVVRTLRRTQRL